MAKWQFTRPGTWSYPTLGFTATTGDVLDATNAPDAWWDSVDAGTPATIGVSPVVDYVEPIDGTVLSYNADTNRYDERNLDEMLEERIDDTGSATRASLNAKYVGKGELVFNVKDYGAVGNGSTVDTTAVQAAIDAANTAGGGTVFFPKGNYRVGGLVCASNITFKGAGGQDSDYASRAVRLTLANTADVPMFTVPWAAGVVNVVWEDLMLTGNSANNSSTGSHGIFFEHRPGGSSDIHYQLSSVRRCNIRDFSGAGVWIGKGAQNVSVTQSFISDNEGDGVRVETSDCFITENHILSNGGCGVRLGNTAVTVANNNSIAGNDLHGISIESGGADTTLYSQADLADHVIIGNSLDKNGRHGIYISAKNTLVANNFLASNSRTTTNTYSNILVNSLQPDGAAAFGINVSNNVFGKKPGVAYSPQYHLSMSGSSTVITGTGNTFSAESGATGTASYPTSLQSRILGDSAVGHIHTVGNITLAAGAANGTTPPNPSGTSSASDHRGSLFFGSGSAPSAGAQLVVTFSRAFPIAPSVTIAPGNSATATLLASGYYVAPTTTGFTLHTLAAPTASQANGTYQIQFVAMG